MTKRPRQLFWGYITRAEFLFPLSATGLDISGNFREAGRIASKKNSFTFWAVCALESGRGLSP